MIDNIELKPCPECTLMRPIPVVGIQACDECRRNMQATNPAQGEVWWNPRAWPTWYAWVPGWAADGEKQYAIDQTPLPEALNSITIPGRGAATFTWCDDGPMTVEVIDGRGVQFTDQMNGDMDEHTRRGWSPKT